VLKGQQVHKEQQALKGQRGHKEQQEHRETKAEQQMLTNL
jgi:hypothetical protein